MKRQLYTVDYVKVSRVLTLIKPSQKSCEKEKARRRLRALFTVTLMGKSNPKSAFKIKKKKNKQQG